jgi:hypothetical protein
VVNELDLAHRAYLYARARQSESLLDTDIIEGSQNRTVAALRAQPSHLTDPAEGYCAGTEDASPSRVYEVVMNVYLLDSGVTSSTGRLSDSSKSGTGIAPCLFRSF